MAMNDPYLLWTPLLVLGVLSLCPFIGCDRVFGVPAHVPYSAPLFLEPSLLSVARNNFHGWVGTVVLIGPTDLLIDSIGRYCLPGNSGAHQVKIVDAATGNDVPGAIVTVSMAGRSPGVFVTVALDPSVNLTAGSSYYVVSEETQNGDTFYDYPTMVTLDGSGAISVPSAVYADESIQPPPPIQYVTIGMPDQSYGPVQITTIRKRIEG
jgi:hypothetical protein